MRIALAVVVSVEARVFGLAGGRGATSGSPFDTTVREFSRELDEAVGRLDDHYDTLKADYDKQLAATNTKLEQADGMHPTPAGVAVIVHRILPSVETLLAAAGANAAG